MVVPRRSACSPRFCSGRKRPNRFVGFASTTWRTKHMTTNPSVLPGLTMVVDKTPTEIVVHCTGKIRSDTTQQLKATVKPLLSESKTVVLDLTNVAYMDSSGLGTIVGLYISSKAAKSQLKLINLNEHLK